MKKVQPSTGFWRWVCSLQVLQTQIQYKIEFLMRITEFCLIALEFVFPRKFVPIPRKLFVDNDLFVMKLLVSLLSNNFSPV